MFILSFAIFLAMVSSQVESGLACCYPPHMEGARYFLEQKQTKYFIADYDRGYIYETLKPGGPNFTIIDLFNYKIYTIEDESCRERTIREPGLYNPCLDDDDIVQYNAILGGAKETVNVDFYDYEVGRYSVFKAVEWSKDGCFPVATQTRIGRYSLTTLFHNVQAQISLPNIFLDLEKKCKVDVREEAEINDSSEEEYYYNYGEDSEDSEGE